MKSTNLVSTSSVLGPGEEGVWRKSTPHANVREVAIDLLDYSSNIQSKRDEEEETASESGQDSWVLMGFLDLD